MVASYSEITGKGADGLLVEESSGFGRKPDLYYGRSPTGVAIVALGLLFCLGVVAMVTYCTVQSVRNEEHVRHLEREMERLKHQMVSQYGSRSEDEGYERNADPYDYGVYGDDTDDGFGGNDDWYGVHDRPIQDQDFSGDNPDDYIDGEDFSFDGDQVAAASRTKRNANRKNRKQHRTERTKKANKKGSRKGRDKLNKDKVNKYIEDKIKEATNMATIHLYGALKHDSDVMEKLRRSPQEYVNQPELDGRLYQQGFVANKETMAFWDQAPWSVNKQTSAIYSFNKTAGSITVKKNGIYFIYAQVHFHDTAAYLGYNVQKVTQKTDPRTLFSCYTSVEPIMHETDLPGVETSYSRYEACSVNGLAELNSGDTIYLRMANRQIRIGAVAQMSYWGLIRISSGHI